MRSGALTACIVAAVNLNGVFSTAIGERSLGERSLGINCRGSFYCKKSNADMYRLINDNIPLNREYNNGEHIACDGHFCAFFQETNTAFSGGAVHRLIEYLYGHCDHSSCGSIPTNYPFSNDPHQNGYLTVNYVKKPDCAGVCR